ncbi:MAG: metal ABC transporter substrate-binding protein [Gemmatimonadaceae bacterium]
MIARHRSLTLFAALALVSPLRPAAAQLDVVTTTTDLYNIARAVGGERISVEHISAGYQDPHFVDAKPSFVLELRDADALALVGLGLEAGWLPLLIDGARNTDIRPGGPGYIDVSQVIPVLDVKVNADRSMGDVHPLGNPHYWLDPANAKRIARLFQERFTALDPRGAATYARNADAFEAKLDATVGSWQGMLDVIRGKPVVAWHTSWNYFADFTGMDIVGYMEPKPGVPPSPSHLAGLILQMRRTGADVIIMEPFYDRKTADFVASRTGAKVLILPPSVGGMDGLQDYVMVMDYNIRQLFTALQ